MQKQAQGDLSGDGPEQKGSPDISRSQLIGLLDLIADVLEAPQNRYGKLEFYTDEAREAREALRLEAVRLDVEASHSIPEQAAKVIRAVLARAGN